MKRSFGALCGVLLLASTVAPGGYAQGADSYVLPPGLTRFSVGIRYTHFDRLYTADGRVAVADPFLAPLTSETFAPLAPLEQGLNQLLTSSGSPLRAGPDNLLLGTADLDVRLDTRVVPFRVEAGILDGLQIGLELPIVRSETRLVRFGLAGGTVGVNPDTAGNASALAEVGEEFRALGESRLLPLATSPLGMALQERVLALTGRELDLPGDTADFAAFQGLLQDELGVMPLASELTPWRVGDAEIDAKYRLLGTFGDALFPTDSTGRHYRVSVSAGIRLPTGSEPDTVRLVSGFPSVGLFGGRVGVQGDWFSGRLWATASAGFATFGGVDVTRRVAPPESPLGAAGLPSLVRWSPGTELAVRVTPRYRLTNEIALGADYALAVSGGSSFELASGEAGAQILDMGGGMAHRIGAEFRYSTLPSSLAGRRLLPIEAIIGVETTLAGPAGAPEAGMVQAEFRVFQRLWGSR